MPYFCGSGRGAADLDVFSAEVEEVGCRFWRSFTSSPLTGDMLVEVVRRKKVTAGSLDGWGWRVLEARPPH